MKVIEGILTLNFLHFLTNSYLLSKEYMKMEKKKKITNKNCMKKKKIFVEIFLNKCNIVFFIKKIGKEIL